MIRRFPKLAQFTKWYGLKVMGRPALSLSISLPRWRHLQLEFLKRSCKNFQRKGHRARWGCNIGRQTRLLPRSIEREHFPWWSHHYLKPLIDVSDLEIWSGSILEAHLHLRNWLTGTKAHRQLTAKTRCHSKVEVKDYSCLCIQILGPFLGVLSPGSPIPAEVRL